MRTPLPLLVLSILLLLGSPLPLPAQEGTPAVKRYSKADLTEDVTYMARTIESVHPNMYHSISKARFQQLKDSVVSVLRDSMTVLEAWPPIARLAAAVDEGHTVLYTPGEMGALLVQQNTGIFPVTISRVAPYGLVVGYDLSPDSVLHTGDIITSINGRSARQLMDRLTSVVGGLRSWRETVVARDFLSYMYLMGIKGPYVIKYTRDREPKTVTLQSQTVKAIMERLAALRKAQPALKQAPYTFVRTDDNIGVLSCNTMETDPDAFETFLEQTFGRIKNDPVIGLIVDLRKNGGGNSYIGYLLLQYLTDKPFRMTGGVHWKVSQEVKDLYARNNTDVQDSGMVRTWATYISMKNGEMIRSQDSRIDTPQANPLRYHGPVGVLIGPATFSSANMTANTIQDYKLATLIGEPTGERPNDYGDVYKGHLPHTDVEFWTSTKLFLRANGREDDHNPVLPDIVVRQSRTSTADDVLEYAKKWIREQAKR